MKYHISILILSLILSGCNNVKVEPVQNFTGTVIGESIGCNGVGPIEAWQIKLDNTDGLDSIIEKNLEWDSTITTVTLPSEFQIINKKIQFNSRNWKSGDPEMTCNTSVFAFEQVVYDVDNIEK